MLLLIQPSNAIEWANERDAHISIYEQNGRTNERKKQIYQLFPTSSSVTDRETTEWILWLVSLCDCNTFFSSFVRANFPAVRLFIGIFQYFLTHLTSSQTLALHSTFVIINYTGCRCRHRRRRSWWWWFNIKHTHIQPQSPHHQHRNQNKCTRAPRYNDILTYFFNKISFFYAYFKKVPPQPISDYMGRVCTPAVILMLRTLDASIN